MQHNGPAPAGKILQLPHQPAMHQNPFNTILEAQAQSIPKVGGLACSWSLSLSLALDFTVSRKLCRCAAFHLLHSDESKSCRLVA